MFFFLKIIVSIQTLTTQISKFVFFIKKLVLIEFLKIIGVQNQLHIRLEISPNYTRISNL